MKKHAAVLLAGCVSLGSLALASGAEAVRAPVSYPLGKAKSCLAGYHKATERHDVRVRVRVHGKWKWRDESRRYVACVLNPVVTTTTSTTTTTATNPAPAPTPAPTPTYSYQAHLDPTFTQGASPLAVTYTYSADATETVDGVTTDLGAEGELPNGILDLYNNGSLACSENVGGTVGTSSSPLTCLVTYSAFGDQTIVTEYIPSSVSPVTETDTENIEQFSPTITVGTATVGSQFVNSDNYYAVSVSIPVSVSGAGMTPTGTITAPGMSCTALTSPSSTCTENVQDSTDASSFTPTIDYSGDTNYSSGSANGSATIPAADAPQNTDVSTSLNVDYTDLGSSGDPGYSDLTVQLNHYPTNSTGTVTFTWDAEDGSESCSTTGALDGAFTCGPVQNETLYPSGGGDTTITATYSGETVEVGDTSETTYESSTGTVSFR